MIVTIDGPAGAGKSTVARLVADRLGVGYLNTGSMYRAVTLLAHRTGTPVDDGAALAALAVRHPIALDETPAGQRVLIDAQDVTAAIRTPAVTADVSAVAGHGAVRREIVAAQRRILASGSWVADGRDIGSVVCPRAEVKVFLTAEPQERARRRHAELVASGEDVALDEVLADIARRDALDSGRAESPLVVPDGAVVVDTSGLGIDAVVDRIVTLAGSARA